MTRDEVMEAARQACRNGCRNSSLGGKPMTCARCEDAGSFAWTMILTDRRDRPAEEAKA
jgi:hypothetical protein